MPVFGKQDVEAAAARAPLMSGFDTAAWELKGAEILQLSYEIAEEPAEWLIPPALHPSIPPYATVSVMHYPNSPVGPFALAQVRIIVRAGIRPRGYLLQAYASTEQAVIELQARWGFTVETAAVSLQPRHDRVIGKVERNGETLLEVELENPEHYLRRRYHLSRQPAFSSGPSPKDSGGGAGDCPRLTRNMCFTLRSAESHASSHSKPMPGGTPDGCITQPRLLRP